MIDGIQDEEFSLFAESFITFVLLLLTVLYDRIRKG
jgi:hypothetical protein